MDEGSVAIVGTGAVGQMLAYFLKKSHINTVLCYGRSGIKALNQTVHLRGASYPLITESSGPIPKLWLFAVKAYDLKSAFEEWFVQIPKDARVVILCNGYIEPEMKGIRKHFPGSHIRKGVVSRGARFADDGSLEISAQGTIKWGDAIHPATAWERVIFQGLEDEGFAWDKESCAARKVKWYCNTVLNTLAGVFKLPRNGDAQKLPEFDALCHEVYELGLSLWPEWEGEEAALKAKLEGLITMTVDNENSMARDMRLGRKTEADYLSGYVKRAQNASEKFPLLLHYHQQLDIVSQAPMPKK